MLEQQDARKQLANHMIKLGIGLLETAALIGISHNTLTNFVSKGKNVRHKQYSLIVNYLLNNGWRIE